MEFANAEIFRDWLIKTLRYPYSNYVADFDTVFNAYLQDVEDSAWNGYYHIEIPARETKSGHAEEYSFNVIDFCIVF